MESTSKCSGRNPIIFYINQAKKKSYLQEVSKMHSEPLLPPGTSQPQQECLAAGVSSLQLSWCGEALGQMVPHASDEPVAPPCANQLPPVAAVAAPTFPSSLCLAIHTSAASESRRAWCRSEWIRGCRAAACVSTFCLTGWAGYYCISGALLPTNRQRAVG